MAKTVSSRKSKGRRLQQQVKQIILDNYKQLEEGDIISTPMGVNGADLILSPKAKKIFPFSVECKNQEKLNIWSSLEQCEKNKDDLIPLLVFKKNYSKTYISMDINDFIKIINKYGNNSSL